MPKEEFDFDDPMELNGVGLVCDEDTTEAMTECFVEEFMRFGHNHRQILALFRNPHYLGMNLALQRRGEQFVRGKISEVFARWGKFVTWPEAAANSLTPVLSPPAGGLEDSCRSNCEAAAASGPSPAGLSTTHSLTDPMGAPVPKLNL